MKKQEGFGLISILLIISALLLTAGGVIVWHGRSFPQPSPGSEPTSLTVPSENTSNPLLPATQTLTGTWKLIAYKNLATGVIETEPEDIERSIVIEFRDDGKNGKLQGHTIINTVNGDYEIFDGNKIKVLRFGGSKAGEGWAWGYKFWDAIRQSSSYQVKGNSLFIYFSNDKELMEFVRK